MARKRTSIDKGHEPVFGYAYCEVLTDSRDEKMLFRCKQYNDVFLRLTGLSEADMEQAEPAALLARLFENGMDWPEVLSDVMRNGRCAVFEKKIRSSGRTMHISLVSPDGRHIFALLWDGLVENNQGHEGTFSEVDFASFFNNLTAGCAIYDVINDGKTGKDYIFKDINKQGLLIEKKTRESMVGKPVIKIRPSVEKFGLISIFKRAWDTGKPQKMAPTHYKDRELDCWFENTVFKMPSGRIAALYQDVSDAVNVQNALKESRDELEAYIQKAPIAIAILDSKGNLIDVNQVGCQYTGFTREELLKMNMREWMKTINNVDAIKSLRDMVLKGRIDTVVAVNLENNRKGMSYFSIRGVKVSEDRFIGFIADVTELHMLDEELKENRDLLRHYFEKAPVCIFVFDNEGRILDTNECAVNLLGYSKQTFLKMSLIDLISKNHTKHIQECFGALQKTGSVTCEQVFCTAKKDEITISINGVKLSEDRFIVFGSNITEQKRLREKLAASEAEFHALFNHAGAGIVYVKPDGRIIWCNQTAAERIGSTPEILEGKLIYEAFTREVVDSYHRRIKEVVNAAKPVEYEDRVKTQEGWRWFKVTQSCIYGQNEQLQGIEIIFHDITDIKLSEFKIKESEEKFRNLFENAPTGNQSLDEAGRLLNVNKKWLEMFGYERDEVIGRLFSDFLSPEYADQFDVCYEECKEKKQMNRRFRIIKKNGDAAIVEQTGTVSVDDRGRFLQTHCSLVDITEQEAAQRRIVESEKRYRSIFNQTALGISSLDPDGRYIQANQKFCDIVGYTKEELLKMTYLDLTHPDDKEESKKRFEYSMHNGFSGAEEYEKRYIRKDGTEVYVQLSSTILFDDEGRPIHTVASVRDLTERKKIEEENERIEARLTEQQRLESIGILAGGVAHEINNPINGIMNYSQLILDDKASNPEVKDYADEIIRESKRVSYIVRNLLRFSRQETEQFAEAKVSEIVDQTLSLIRTLIRHDYISLSIHVPEHLPKIKCREQQIQQVVMNLMTNARDALNARYPDHDKNKVLKVSAEKIEEPGFKGIRIVVEDHGTGIPEKIRARIFDPFFTTKGRDKGTGLGLAISHRIVTDHNGRFDVECKPEEYTRFYVDLPYQPDNLSDTKTRKVR